MTTTIWRYFFAHQDAGQEAWLEQQAQRGLHLERPGLFRFTFRRGEPGDERYRLDFQTLRGAARADYLALFADAGWEFVGQVANRYYFRARPGAMSPEIFSDVESRKERIRRQVRFAAALTAVLVLQVSIAVMRILESRASGVAEESNVPMMTIAFAGAFACFGAWMTWKMQQAYRQQE